MQLIVKLTREEVIAQENEFGVIPLLVATITSEIKRRVTGVSKREINAIDKVFDTLFGFSEGIFTRKRSIDSIETITGTIITDYDHMMHLINKEPHYIKYGYFEVDITE